MTEEGRVRLVQGRRAPLPRRAYLLLLVDFFVLVLLFMGSIYLYTKTNATLQGIEEEQVTLYADHVASIVQRTVTRTVAVGEDLESTMITEFGNATAISDDVEAHLMHIGPAFETIGVKASNVAAVYAYFDPDLYGMRYLWYVREDESMVFRPDAFENETGYLSRDAAVWSENESFVWYYDVRKDPVPQWTDIYWDADVRTHYISYLVPMMIDGRFVGMVGVDVDLEGLKQELMSEDNLHGEMAVVDEGGNFIFGSEEMFTDWNLTEVLLEGERGSMQIGEQDIGFHRLENGMLAIIVIDEGESPLSVDLLQAYLLLGVIIATLLIVIGGGCAVTEMVLRHYAGTKKTGRMSLRMKVMVFGTVCVMLAAGILSTYHMSDRVLEHLEDERIAMTVSYAAAEVESITIYVEATANDLNSLVASGFDIDAAHDGTYAQGYLDGIAPEFMHITAASRGFTGSYAYLDADAFGVRYLWFNLDEGTFVRAFDTEADVPGYLSVTDGTWRDDPDYVWYYDGLLHGTAVWTGKYYDTDLGYDCVSYVMPIYKDRRIIGVVGSDVSLVDLQDALSNMSELRSRAMLIDKNGEFIVGSSDIVEDWDAVKVLLNLESGMFHVRNSESGEITDLGYRRLSNGMMVVMIGDADESKEMIGGLRRTLFSIMFVVIALLVGVIGFWLLKYRKSVTVGGGWSNDEPPASPNRVPHVPALPVTGVRDDIRQIIDAFCSLRRK